jgi:hypothetical protein
MNSKLRDLLPAIVSRVIERGSFVSKTKLLKLLYLFDLEWYRVHRETYTGFDWIFHLLGPWTREYDNVLDTFYANEFLRKRSGNDSYDTEFIVTDEQIQLHRLFDSRDDERILEDLILKCLFSRFAARLQWSINASSAPSYQSDSAKC